MLSFVLGISLFEIVASALVHKLPQQTSVREDQLRGFIRIPKPTPAPRLPQEFRRRQSGSGNLTTLLIGPDRVCGFVSGFVGNPHNCAASDYCVLQPATSAGFGTVACCGSKINNCSVVTTCIDANDYSSTTNLCDDSCRQDTKTLKCTDSARPYCNSIRFVGAAAVDYLCGATSTSSYQLAFTTFSGENTSQDGRSWKTATYNQDGYLTNISTDSGDPNGIILTGGSLSLQSDASSTLSSSPTGVGAPKSPYIHKKALVPVSAIIGGTIGFVALIALIAAGAFILKQKYGHQMEKVDSVSIRSKASNLYIPPAYCSSRLSSVPSEMHAVDNDAFMQQHESFDPQVPQQSYNPPSVHHYQTIPTRDTPAAHNYRKETTSPLVACPGRITGTTSTTKTQEVHNTYYRDERFVPPTTNLRRMDSTAQVSTLTGNDTVAKNSVSPASSISFAPTFVPPSANIREAPGSYEYLEPQLLYEIHEQGS